MYALSKRNIASGHEYNAYFPPANNATELVNQNGNLGDTTRLMQEIIAISVPQTAQIAPMLRGRNLRETCQNIFDFVYKHINYRRDDKGKEQVRSAARTWHDRHRGVDCDCYSVFISSMLINLGIAHAFRIAKYDRAKGFQHVYIVVPEPQNPKRYYTIDPVLDDFDKEHQPLIEYRDYPIAPEKYESFRGLGEPISAAIGIVTGTISLAKTISGLFGDKRPKTLPPEQIAQVAAMAAFDNHFRFIEGEKRIKLTNSELYRAIQVIFEEIKKAGKEIDPTWTGAVYWMLGKDKAKSGKQMMFHYRSTEWPLMIYPFFQPGRVLTPQNLKKLYEQRGILATYSNTENKAWINQAIKSIEESWILYKTAAAQYQNWQQSKQQIEEKLGFISSALISIKNVAQATTTAPACKSDEKQVYNAESKSFRCEKKTKQDLLNEKVKNFLNSRYVPTTHEGFIARANPISQTFFEKARIQLEEERRAANAVKRDPFDYIPDVATPEASAFEVIAAMQNTMLAAAQAEAKAATEAAKARSAAAKSSVPETQNTKDNSKALLWIGLGTAGLLLIGATAYYVTNKNKNT